MQTMCYGRLVPFVMKLPKVIRRMNDGVVDIPLFLIFSEVV